ncbi:PREDICTED: death ligand signal enhancer [Pseudopodoces humilis]|uniref:death ligand signal enhancer n=1 Tax=Pseudopodoces humilis TaxID=181119 RepID=UPI0006B6C1DF|nr:PREDICTED: death ligand signal enhancer [Pseudopodoces humilis]
MVLRPLWPRSTAAVPLYPRSAAMLRNVCSRPCPRCVPAMCALCARRAPAVPRPCPPARLYGPRVAGGAGGMWRLLLLLGRGRCAPTPARPACAPGLGGGRGHSPERAAACQDGPQRGGGGRRALPGLVPRYSVREAVTWGAVGAVLLQLLRQIAGLRSLPDSRTERRLPWSSSLPPQPAAVTEASAGCPGEQLGSQFLQKASPEAVAESSSSGIPSGQGESQPWAEAGEFQIPVSCRVGPALHSAKGDPAQRGQLEEAAFQLQQIFRIDISIALNILGIESMRAGHSRVAFTCFRLAADRGYSKAQFNVGLCYEHGRGTEKDLEKAGFYYCQAASSRHPMAQYRYARYLLQHGPGSLWDRNHKAVALLEQAAGAGITEAQAYLGVFYMRGLQPQEERGLKYLLQAANSGDAQSRFHVGVCHEQGLGVQQNVAEALRHYRQSAAAGNRQAQDRLRAWQQELRDVHTKHPFPSGLRASSSSPNFWTIEPVSAGQPGQCGLTLPHSWSTGRLHVMLLSSAGWSRALRARTVPLELQGWEPQHCWP